MGNVEQQLRSVKSPSLFASRPTNVWSLIVLNLIAGAISFGAAFAPITQHRFIGTGIVFGAVFLVGSAILWIFAQSIGRIGLLVEILICIAAFSTIIAKAPNIQGAILVSFGFTWMTIYTASFLGRKDLYFVLTCNAIGCAGAFAAFGLHRWIAVWVLVMATTCTTGITLERSASRLRHEAETDPMTGLLNRRGFFKGAMFEMSVAERIGASLSVVLIDLDHFKEVNDSKGHSAGDRLLVDLTAAWSNEMRPGDLLARFGGDEFIMLIPEGSTAEVQLVLDRLRAVHPIDWTAGVAILASGESIETCIERADEHLYQVKMHERETPPRFKAASA